MEDPRTTTARDNDDSAIIDAAVDNSEPGATVGRSGGNLARDVATQDERTRAVDDPDAHTRVTKQDDIDNGVARPADRGANRQ